MENFYINIYNTKNRIIYVLTNSHMSYCFKICFFHKQMFYIYFYRNYFKYISSVFLHYSTMIYDC